MVDASARQADKISKAPAAAEAEIQSLKKRLSIRERELEALHILFDSNPLCYQSMDENGKILTVNPTWERTFGYKRSEAVDRSFKDFLSPKCLPLFDEAFECFKQMGEIRDKEFNIFCSNGRSMEVAFYGRVGLAPDDELVHTHCYLIDVAKRKETERRLRYAKEQLELILESTNLGAWDQNFVTGEVIRDERWAQMLGYRPDELPSLLSAWEAIIHPDDIERVKEMARRHESGEIPVFKVEHRMLTKSGEWKWILNFGKVTERDKEGKPLRAVGTHLDITEQKTAEEQNRKVEARLREAQRIESLSLLAAGVAHDFNNLLQGIMGNASLALLDLPVFSKVRKRIEAIEQATHHATELTRQMLAYSGKGAFVIQVQDLTVIINDMLDIIKASISKKVMLHLDLQADLPPVEADITQIHQILLNLVNNGSDAIGDQPGHMVIRTGVCEIDAEDQPSDCPDGQPIAGRHVFFEVVDSGCGMAPETRARIFDPFFSTKFTGRGLGLAAVMGIVRGHKGCIQVNSTPGEGSTFRVLLSPSSKSVDMISAPRKTRPWSWKGTVLVADDEKVVRNVVRQMLERIGCKVMLAKDGHQAMSLYRENFEKIDLVLLDLTMPRLNGEEALALIREIDSGARVILSSGYNREEACDRFKEHAHVGFIQKPYRFDEFVDVFRSLVE